MLYVKYDLFRRDYLIKLIESDIVSLIADRNYGPKKKKKKNDDLLQKLLYNVPHAHEKVVE